MNQFGNPYMNPYGIQPQYQQTMLPQKDVDRVNGRNGALQYPMGANSKAWVLDESGLISWLIITDSACYKTVTPYDVTPHEDAPAPDFASLESRIKKLEETLNASTADTTATRRRRDDTATD